MAWILLSSPPHSENRYYRQVSRSYYQIYNLQNSALNHFYSFVFNLYWISYLQCLYFFNLHQYFLLFHVNLHKNFDFCLYLHFYFYCFDFEILSIKTDWHLVNWLDFNKSFSSDYNHSCPKSVVIDSEVENPLCCCSKLCFLWMSYLLLILSHCCVCFENYLLSHIWILILIFHCYQFCFFANHFIFNDRILTLRSLYFSNSFLCSFALHYYRIALNLELFKNDSLFLNLYLNLTFSCL
jgi:hypothetical protein